MPAHRANPLTFVAPVHPSAAAAGWYSVRPDGAAALGRDEQQARLYRLAGVPDASVCAVDGNRRFRAADAGFAPGRAFAYCGLRFAAVRRLTAAVTAWLLVPVLPIASAPAFTELVKSAAPAEVEAAIRAGAEVNARGPNGWTPLMAAARYNPAVEITQKLLAAGADGRHRTKKGKPAFDLATENRKLEGTAAYWALDDARY